MVRAHGMLRIGQDFVAAPLQLVHPAGYLHHLISANIHKASYTCRSADKSALCSAPSTVAYSSQNTPVPFLDASIPSIPRQLQASQEHTRSRAHLKPLRRYGAPLSASYC
eukprot:6016428-Pyramimonas_sp.AAC.1